MNGLEILNSISKISIDSLYVMEKVNDIMTTYELSELPLSKLINLDWNSFTGLEYYDGNWCIVFAHNNIEEKEEKIVVEPEIKRGRRRKAEIIEEPVKESVEEPTKNEWEDTAMNIPTETTDDFDLFA